MIHNESLVTVAFRVALPRGAALDFIEDFLEYACSVADEKDLIEAYYITDATQDSK